jgi:hypothetical protein
MPLEIARDDLPKVLVDEVREKLLKLAAVHEDLPSPGT